MKRTLNLYVVPSCMIHPEAEAVHHITMPFLNGHGIPPCEALDRFFEFLGRDALLVAHNIHFDFRMLQNECRKFEYVADPDELSFCDTVALARKLVPGLPHYNLATLIEALGIEMHRRAQLGGDLRRSRTAKRRASGCARTVITRSTTRWRAARCSSIS